MPRLPQISGRELIQALCGYGYEEVRQKGSHVGLRKQTEAGEHKITVRIIRPSPRERSAIFCEVSRSGMASPKIDFYGTSV